MNKVYIPTSILICFVSLFTHYSFSIEPITQGNIKLISSDKKEFIIPKNESEQSLFIKNALASKMKEAKEGVIRLKLPSNIVKLTTELMRISAQSNKNEKELISLTSKTLKNYDISYDAMKDILPTMVDFLDIQKQEIPLIHYTVTKFFKNKPTKIVENKIKKDFPERLHGLFAKYYYLIYGSNHKFITVDEDYGYSIQELIDYKKLPTIISNNKTISLDLNFLKINSLTGLKNIPSIKLVRRLDLSFNKIKIIEHNSFSELNNLKRLDLSFNKIEKIEPNAFKNLNNLELLLLHHNKIKTIKPNAFSNLNNLKKLQLYQNPLSDPSKKALKNQFGDKVLF